MIDDLTKEVLQLDRAYVAKTVELLTAMGATRPTALSFFNDWRKVRFRVTDKAVYHEDGRKFARVKEHLDIVGHDLVPPWPEQHSKDGLTLYVCDYKGLRYGILVEDANNLNKAAINGDPDLA